MIVAVDDHRLFVPQRDQPLVIMQDGVFVPNLCFGVDRAVIAFTAIQGVPSVNTAAIGFICMDYVMARTVVYAAEATNTPAIIMLFPEHVTIQGTTGFAGYAAMVKELAEQVKVPIGLHCDHDYSYDAIMNTIAGGFGSVMMDGSVHDLDTNIRLTKEVVDKAHELGVFVEGEIGHVGAAAASDNDKEDLYTKPDAAARFCRETGVDSLAVSIGNAHGDYKETPHLDMKRLDEIHAATDVPLVLHGSEGVR